MAPRSTRSSKKPSRKPTVGCLFAGMGGFARGFADAGFNVLWANEIDKFAAASFCENYRGVRMVRKDVRELTVKADELEAVDVLTAGFPCQTFSISGDQKGFDDERGTLFFEIIRLLDEFEKNKPKILVLENVPNLMSGNSGLWFEEIMHKVQRAGYWFDNHSCKILNTCEVSDIPQNRKRLFMVGTSVQHYNCNNYQFPEKNGKTSSLAKFVSRTKKGDDSQYLRIENKYYQKIEASVKSGDRKSIFQLRRYDVREKSQICPTLTANMGGGGHNVPFIRDRWGIRRLSVEECQNLQGFNGYAFPDDVPRGERYKQIGNAISVPVARKLATSCKALLTKE